MTKPFSRSIQKQALIRQDNFCASCGTAITALGNKGQADHEYGEAVQAHHVLPYKSGGPNIVDNCVILCFACHINAHAGGDFRNIDMYDDLDRMEVSEKMRILSNEYPHFNGNNKPSNTGS